MTVTVTATHGKQKLPGTLGRILMRSTPGAGGGGFQVRWSHRMDELQADASRKGTSIL